LTDYDHKQITVVNTAVIDFVSMAQDL
jgi:hypothetical protein